MRDIAIVAFAQAPAEQAPGQTETLMLLPTITRALADVGLTRRDVGFTCSGSADYLTGGTFTFVQMLEAAGAWPPIPESHVEMDGAWALHEAWVRLQHGDVDVALVFSSGRASLGVSLRETLTFQLDPYYLAPLGADYVSLAALQGEAVMARTGRTERDLAEIVAARTGLDVDKLLAEPYVVAPLRPHDIGPPVDGAAAVVLVAGEKAGVGQGGIEVAELHAVCTPEEIVLADALGLGDDVDINPSGGAIVSNPMMVTGLVRIGEAFKQIAGGRTRALGHASSGPCLQQNLVCVLEGR
jgi:acetyl-CoA acetyltransferase